MNEKINTPSVDWYFNTYGANGIGRGADRMLIRQQLIDAFRREIFQTVALRAKKEFNGVMPDTEDPRAKDIAQSVIRETTKKWKSLVKRFEMYRETAGLLKIDDLTLEEEDKDAETRIKNMDDNGTIDPTGSVAN